MDITASVAPNLAANKMLESLVESLKLRYPQHRLSYGYIGNIERWGDDRCFRIFTRYLNCHGSSECYHLGGWSTLSFNDELEARITAWVNGLDLKYQKRTLLTGA